VFAIVFTNLVLERLAFAGKPPGECRPAQWKTRLVIRFEYVAGPGLLPLLH
jgi:hypothetical protein